MPTRINMMAMYLIRNSAMSMPTQQSVFIKNGGTVSCTAVILICAQELWMAQEIRQQAFWKGRSPTRIYMAALPVMKSQPGRNKNPIHLLPSTKEFVIPKWYGIIVLPLVTGGSPGFFRGKKINARKQMIRPFPTLQIFITPPMRQSTTSVIFRRRPEGLIFPAGLTECTNLQKV